MIEGFLFGGSLSLAFLGGSFSMPGDLHNHSTCSDGSVPIHRLPLMAARAGLDTMAISDHDTLLSVNYCYEHPAPASGHRADRL